MSEIEDDEELGQGQDDASDLHESENSHDSKSDPPLRQEDETEVAADRDDQPGTRQSSDRNAKQKGRKLALSVMEKANRKGTIPEAINHLCTVFFKRLSRDMNAFSDHREAHGDVHCIAGVIYMSRIPPHLVRL